MEKDGNYINIIDGKLLSSVIFILLLRRGFSLIFGHWPSNVDLAIKIKNKESVFDDDGDTFLIYLFIMAGYYKL